MQRSRHIILNERKRFIHTHIVPFIMATLLSLSFTACSNKPADDAVEYSFVVLGDCRVDKTDTNSVTNPAGVNFAELDRQLADIAKLDQKPTYVFFNGDEIFGYEHDTAKLAHAFSIWRDSVEASPVVKAGINFIAIPGNHETDVDSADMQVASPLSEHIWTETMMPLIKGDNGPHAGGPDSLATDQSHLTYSFNYRDTHFILMDTDPAGKESQVPSHWIEADITTAKKQGAKHVFAIGHKPAFNADGSMSMASGNRSDFWAALEDNHCEAMIGSHVHEYARFQPHHKGTWMVISGNGGTPLNKNISENQHYFGFTLVSILKSGKVILKSYGHDVPSTGYAADAPADKYPTTMRDSVDITWKD